MTKAYRNKYRLLSTDDLCEAAEALTNMPHNERQRDEVILALVDRVRTMEQSIANIECVKR